MGWDASADLHGDQLGLTFMENGSPVFPTIETAVFGRATSVTADQTPDFTIEGGAFVAPVTASDGNWNLRVVARAPDGTKFQQRIVVGSAS